MKNILLILSLILLSPSLYAHKCANDSVKTKLQQPLIVVNGEDLQKYPSNNLLEALDGRIPGYDSFSQSSENFLFIVDGIYTSNINSIATGEIEEVSFYRGGFTGSNGIYALSAGTFVIKTKRSKYDQPLSTTFLIQAGNNNPSTYTDHYFSQNYQIGVHKGYSIVKYGFGLNYSKMYNNGSFTKDNEFKVNANIDIKPLKWLETGVHLNFNPNRNNQSAPLTSFELSYQQKDKRSFLNGDAYLTLTPLKGLINTFTVAKYNATVDVVKESKGVAANYTLTSDFQSDNSVVFYNNKLSYELGVFNDKLKLGGSFTYDKIVQHFNENQRTLLDGIDQTASIKRMNSLNESLIGGLTLNLYDILQLEGGYRLDKISTFSPKKDLESPYGSLTFDARKAFYDNNNIVSSTIINFSYSKRPSIAGQNGLIVFTGYSPDLFPAIGEPLGTKVFSASTSIGFWNNRLFLNGDWFNNTSSTHVPINYSYDAGFITVMYPSEVKTQGWRIWTNADLISTSLISWTAGLNLSKQKSKIELPVQVVYPPVGEATKAQPIINDSYKGMLLGGIQNKLTYKNISLDINGSFCLNRQSFARTRLVYQEQTDSNGIPIVGYEAIDYNSFMLNYMAIGYSLNKSILKYVNDAGLFLVAKNILEINNKNDFYTRSPKYLGLSLKVTL